MEGTMLASRHLLQVLRAVIVPNPVDVVDVIAWLNQVVRMRLVPHLVGTHDVVRPLSDVASRTQSGLLGEDAHRKITVAVSLLTPLPTRVLNPARDRSLPQGFVTSLEPCVPAIRHPVPLPGRMVGSTQLGRLSPIPMSRLEARTPAIRNPVAFPCWMLCPAWLGRLPQQSVPRLELMLRRIVPILELRRFARSEERRAGKECRSPWSPCH